MLINKCLRLGKGLIHRTHKDGHFYMLPPKFPFVLHDMDGCILIDEQIFRELESCNKIRISHSKNGDKINVCKCISSLPGYESCDKFERCPECNIR